MKLQDSVLLDLPGQAIDPQNTPKQQGALGVPGKLESTKFYHTTFQAFALSILSKKGNQSADEEIIEKRGA